MFRASLQYTGGVYDTYVPSESNHIVSIVGWSTDKKTGEQYWIVRNSWGEYWGEMGYFRIALGKNLLQIEASCAWATPGSWTEHNLGCYEDGTNCVSKGEYVDPGYAAVAESA